ncbi:hypothetical protein Tco_1533394 [Tanacetum coccineum]
MPYPKFTKIIINHFLSKHQSFTKLQYLHTHTIKDDGVVSRLKFFRIGEDFQEYGVPIPKTMLTEGIKQSESYQMFIKYSTILIPPKKSRDDNIIPEPDVALELAKSISLTEAAKEKAARQVHATHERIVSESDPEPARGRPLEQLAADTMQALKASRKSSRSQSITGGSSEGTGVSPGVPDESIVIPTTSSKGTDEEDEEIEWVDTDEEEEKNDNNDDKSIDLEKIDDDETDDEFVHSEEHVQEDDEETDDEFVNDDEQVNDDEDEKMTNAEDADTRNSDEEITNAIKADAEKTKEAKDDIKDADFPSLSSSLSVSSGFGNQFLNLSSNKSIPLVLKPILGTPSVAPAKNLLPPLSVSTIPPVLLQLTIPIPAPPITIEAPLLKEVDNTATLHASLRFEISSVVNAYLGSSLGDELHKVLQKYMEELIQHYPQQVDYKEIIKEYMQANLINEVKNQLPKFLPKAVSDFATPVIQSTIKNELEKTPLLLAQSSSQAPSSLKTTKTLSEYELKTILFEKINKSYSYLTHDKHQALFDALLNSLSLDDAIARGQANLEKVPRKRDRDDEDPSAVPNQGKSLAKTSKSGKSVTTKEPVEMASDDVEQTIDDVANDVDQPPDDSTQTKDKTPMQDWFK